uniref:ORF60 n=1 Tax=Nitrosopumilaceae spindle-shaped virus TaxID=3065433 RepID=A0AAT9JAP1_9VIRU
MGGIRTARPIYQDGCVMEFYVRKQEVHYKIKLWNKEGTNQSLLQEGILGDQDARQVLNKAIQNLSNVEVKK